MKEGILSPFYNLTSKPTASRAFRSTARPERVLQFLSMYQLGARARVLWVPGSRCHTSQIWPLSLAYGAPLREFCQARSMEIYTYVCLLNNYCKIQDLVPNHYSFIV